MMDPRNAPGATKPLKPFLRWAGGKRWLAKDLAPIIRSLLRGNDGTYYEPFLGAGAMFFGLAPQRAHLSDINPNLIATYKTISNNALEVEQRIREYSVTSATYYTLRAATPVDPIEAAARFVYLNRTCYGGLYRENKAGHFNTPYGGGSRTPEAMLREGLIARAQFALRGTQLECCDFQETIARAGRGDVVYCDPTYSNVKRDGFDRYGANLFDWNDQERLAYCAELAMERGATVIVSNGSFSELFELYPAAYRIALKRKKTLGNRALSETRYHEHLLILDPLNRLTIWREIGAVENRKSKTRFSSRYQVPSEDAVSVRASQA